LRHFFRWMMHAGENKIFLERGKLYKELRN